MYSVRRLAAAIACPALMVSAAACTPDTSRQDSKPPSANPSDSASGSKAGALRPSDAIGRLKVAREARVGYERDKFRLWIDADHDGCDNRKEVLLAEAVKKPRQGAGCKLTGGSWRSYYDDKTVTDARKLDIDHVVPLAEAWDSGASKWTPKRREQYANDLDNRTKGDKDPGEWMPPAKDATCTYATDWVAAKLRWKLTADAVEVKALRTVAAGCGDATVTFTPAP
ncbi:HNH endonuclease family protein [Streptomyces kronopolitis]